MSEAHPASSLFVICVFFAAASSVTMAATTPMLETTTEKHPCNWSQKGKRDHNIQSCYLFVSELVSFYQANESCVDEGAHLVSIDNKDENELVANLTSTDVWIGLYRLTNEPCAGNSCTTWMWLDGSGLEYVTWTDELSPTPTQCVFMTTAGTWEHSRLCSRNQGFVCKKSIPPSTTPEPTTMPVTSEMTDTSLPNSANPDFPDKKKTIDRPGNADKRPIIIGCVVGGLALVVIVTVVAVVFLKRHRRSPRTDQPMEDKEEETPPVAKHVRYNPGYEDVDLGETQGATNVTFKPSTGNTDTGSHSGGNNQLYSEPMKETDQPGSKDILVNENTLYGSGK